MTIQMTKVHKKFITKKLFPFILREQGRGFSMFHWSASVHPGNKITIDGLTRRAPSCGIIACIGGSVEALRVTHHPIYRPPTMEEIAASIGLSYPRGRILFFGWQTKEMWPNKFRIAYAKARSVIGKARVAVSLLHEVVRTSGKILDMQWNPVPGLCRCKKI